MVSFCSGLDLFAWTLAQSCPGSGLVKLRASADLCARTYGVRKCGLDDFFFFLLLCRASTLVNVRRSEPFYLADYKMRK